MKRAKAIQFFPLSFVVFPSPNLLGLKLNYNLNLKKNENDEKIIFTKKEEEGLEIMIGLPPLKRMMAWLFIIGIMLRWISIIKLMDILDGIFKKTIEETETQKKWFIFLIQILILLNTNNYKN